MQTETAREITALERRLASIWRDVLNRPVVAPLDTLSRLNATPAQASAIAAEIRRVFNVSIASTTLCADGATLRRISEFIEDDLNCGPLSN